MVIKKELLQEERKQTSLLVANIGLLILCVIKLLKAPAAEGIIVKKVILNGAKQMELKKTEQIAARLNMLPNMLWTALFVSPVGMFCYLFLTVLITCTLLGASLIPVFFPTSFFDKIQLSQNAAFYERIGVRYINALAQNGSVLNAYMRKKYPDFKIVAKTKASVRKHYYRTYFFEKFHFSLFLFFTMIAVVAIIKGQFYWALVVAVANLFYNIYPNLLQQYVRVKLKSAVADKRYL